MPRKHNELKCHCELVGHIHCELWKANSTVSPCHTKYYVECSMQFTDIDHGTRMKNINKKKKNFCTIVFCTNVFDDFIGSFAVDSFANEWEIPCVREASEEEPKSKDNRH